jgi:hypothetical protein
MTRDPDVNLIGMIMLEPADLKRDSVQASQVNSYVLVAKHLLLGKADAGFFLKEAFDDLSGPIRKQLRPAGDQPDQRGAPCAAGRTRLQRAAHAAAPNCCWACRTTPPTVAGC